MTITTYLAYLLACAAIIIVPGPTVTLIIANSIRHGARAGLMNVAGTQFGLAIMVAVLALGLQAVVATMAGIFDFLRIAGAAYLVWLGVRLWRADGALAEDPAAQTDNRGGRGHFWQGFFVILSNPKALFFFGAFIPQFVNPASNTVAQTALLGVTFMVVATIFDGAYAVLAGRAGGFLTRSRLRWAERISGTFLIGGGVWLALLRR
ncbi:MAG: LysE family translocator [Rhodobiaceae bacterium]|nr:LysE family translocator [Rhodobiaceae bacterium]MCC0057033.1 LysE family translocator [Rhodobiaceae bacterium]